MKAFLEEYGLVIVIVIVVAALIGLASLLSTKGKKSMEDTFDSMVSIGDTAVKNAESAAADVGNGDAANP